MDTGKCEVRITSRIDGEVASFLSWLPTIFAQLANIHVHKSLFKISLE